MANLLEEEARCPHCAGTWGFKITAFIREEYEVAWCGALQDPHAVTQTRLSVAECRDCHAVFPHKELKKMGLLT